MKIRTTFWFLLFVVAFMTNSVVAQQPYGGCWHPEHVKDWSPETDPNAKFNRSTVALQPRFKEENLIKANQYQFYEGQVCNSTILQHMCSTCPSQGANEFVGYNPTYWQYMDLVVWWAGSASEGIIIPPSAPCIDVAHMNGVRILGQVFFPPSAFGGISQWGREVLETKDKDGRHTFARKFFEIADYLGFDGWFINEEIGYGSSSAWANFIADFNRFATEGGKPEMEIQWYRAQGSYDSSIMNSHVNTSMFLEYGSPSSCQSQMTNLQGLGFTKEQAFKKLYFGTECVKAGLTGIGGDLGRCYGNTGHHGSIDLFCPEEHIWKDHVKDLLDKPEASGERAHAAMVNVFKNEEIFWVNRNGDPSNVSNRSSWAGMSGHILERSVLSYKPFVTAFSAGLGKHRFVNGKKVNTRDWYHRGMQNIMPTWRWWIENNSTDNLKIELDWDDAYNFGTSLKVSGKLTANQDHLTRFYKTQIAVENGDKLQLIYKTNTPNSIGIQLGIKENSNNFTALSTKTTTTNEGWTIDEYDLSALNGKTISIIALNFKSASEVASYTASLGQMGILPANYSPTVAAVKNVNSPSELSEDGGDVRLLWDVENWDNVSHFNVYMNTSEGRQLVGQTRNEAFYIPKFGRVASTGVVFDVVPVAKDFTEKQGTSHEVEYPELTAPVVTLIASKTYVLKNEVVTIEARATGFPTNFVWTLPDGAVQQSISEDKKKITVKCTQEGMLNIKVDVTNEIGTTNHSEDLIEVVSSNDLRNISVGKSIHSYSGSANASETPAKLIDGNAKPSSMGDKWCNIATDHWAIIDLQGVYQIYSFKAYDCNHNESGENYPNYRISVSSDLQNWTLVVDEKGRYENIKEDWIKPTMGRYVKFEPYKDGMMTIRIWEFEVFGKEGNNNMRITTPDEVRVNSGESMLFDVNYDLNGDNRANEFYCTVVSSNEDFIQVGEIRENKEAGKFTVELLGQKAIGRTELKITVFNGGLYRERKIDAIVDSNEAPNVLAGLPALIRANDSGWTEFDVMTLTDGNKTANGFTGVEESWEADDRWAIFESDDVWNLAKVKIFLLDKNVKTINIKTSNDKSNWSASVAELSGSDGGIVEYIFPDIVQCKYLGFEFDVEPAEVIQVAEIEAYEQLPEALPVIVPLVVKTGFSMDGIAEAKPTKDYTSDKMDGQGWVFYTSGVQAEGAIPLVNGSLKSATDIPYKFGPLDGNNVFILKDTPTQGSMTFEGNHKAKALYFLATSFEGASTVYAKVTYADGSASTETTFQVQDWCGTGSGTAIGSIGRVIRERNGSYTQDLVETPKCRMFEFKLDTDPTKIITSLDIRKTGKWPAIFAVTKDGVPQQTTAKLTRPRSITLKETKTSTVEAEFEFLTEKEDNFAITVMSEDAAVVEILNENINETEGKFTFDVKGLQEGRSDITIKLVNGETELQVTFTATIEAAVRESLSTVDDLALKENDVKNIQLAYSFGDMEKNAQFSITATAANDEVIEILNENINEAEGKFTFDVKALKEGQSEITVTLTNGTSVKTETFEASVVSVLPESLDRPADITLELGESENVSAAYSLGDMQKEDNFAINASANNDGISVSDKNIGSDSFTFTVKAEATGSTIVTVTLVNGTNTINREFTVTVTKTIAESLEQPEDMTIEYGKTEDVSVAYSLGTIPEAANFNIAVDVEKSTIAEILNKEIEDDAVKFSVKAWAAGDTKVTVTLTNGERVIVKEFVVTVFQIVEESLEEPENIMVDQSKTKDVSLAYSLGTIEKAENFAITVVAENEQIIGILNVDITESAVTFDVEGLREGNSKVIVTLTNGEKVIKREFFVTVQAGNKLNDVHVSEVNIWPNPANAGAVLNIATEGARSVRLISLQGVVIMEQTIYDASTQLSLEKVQPGTYFVQVLGEKMKMAKVIVR